VRIRINLVRIQIGPLRIRIKVPHLKNEVPRRRILIITDSRSCFSTLFLLVLLAFSHVMHFSFLYRHLHIHFFCCRLSKVHIFQPAGFHRLPHSDEYRLYFGYQCTKNTHGRGRVIERTEHAVYIEQNRKNIEKNEHFYKQRQAIVEHPYGTINRQWGYNYILTKKGKERASADVGFMFITYNLRRIIKIIGQKRLRECLKELLLSVFHLWRTIRGKTEPFFRSMKECSRNLLSLKYLFNLNVNPKVLLKFI